MYLKYKLSMKSYTDPKKGKKKKILDLSGNGEVQEDLEGDGLGMTKDVHKNFNLLSVQLCACSICGNSVFCKLSITNEHSRLTLNDVMAWATAITKDTNGVTVKLPPNTERFAAFHRPKPATTLIPVTSKYGITSMVPATAPAAAPAPSPFESIILQLLMSQQRNPTQEADTTSCRDSLQVPAMSKVPSSDGLSDTQAYPTIEQFLNNKHATDPRQQRHNLPNLAYKFTTMDFYCIDEISRFSAKELESIFDLSAGNALYIEREVKREVKEIRKHQRHNRSQF